MLLTFVNSLNKSKHLSNMQTMRSSWHHKRGVYLCSMYGGINQKSNFLLAEVFINNSSCGNFPTGYCSWFDRRMLKQCYCLLMLAFLNFGKVLQYPIVISFNCEIYWFDQGTSRFKGVINDAFCCWDQTTRARRSVNTRCSLPPQLTSKGS